MGGLVGIIACIVIGIFAVAFVLAICFGAIKLFFRILLWPFKVGWWAFKGAWWLIKLPFRLLFGW